jgi:gentisate 1,2-dioxygenase
MPNYYDDWLRLDDDLREQCAKAKKCIHEEELEWVRTKQDCRAALLCSRQNGFLTAGDISLAEIPPGWNTGKHSHGEEAIFIVKGKGCSVIDGKRYDWEDESCLSIPFGVAHQHFNLGNDTVRYLSVMALALEIFAVIAKVSQFENVSETHLHAFDEVPMAESDIHPEYGRIILRGKDAPLSKSEEQGTVYSEQTEEYYKYVPQEMKTPGIISHSGGNSKRYMRWKDTGFQNREVEITHLSYRKPGSRSGKHAHMEAILYCLGGEGYSILDGERIDWKNGSLLHVPGPQTVHQHWVTGNDYVKLLRISYGLRTKMLQALVKKVFPYLYYEFADSGD